MLRVWVRTVVASGVTLLALLAPRAVRADWVDEWKPLDSEVGPSLKPKKAAGPVVPESERVHFDDRPFSIQLRFGISSNLGLAGVAAEYDVDDRIAVGVGLGATRLGPVTEAHTRWRPLVYRMRGGKSAHAVVVEFAASRSRYEGSSLDLSQSCEPARQGPFGPCQDLRFFPDWVWSGQLEIGWEFRSKTGIVVRTTSGINFALTSPAYQCATVNGSTTCLGSTPSRRMPYATTLALGYAF